MPWYENTARILKAKGVSNAEIGRRLNITGQAVQMKLAGKRPTTVTEAKVFADFAGVAVAEMLGEDAYLIEARDEIELVELFRLLTPKQRTEWLAYGRFLAAQSKPDS
jgi:transcriptional regulator with XRE-family HTH domain